MSRMTFATTILQTPVHIECVRGSADWVGLLLHHGMYVVLFPDRSPPLPTSLKWKLAGSVSEVKCLAVMGPPGTNAQCDQ